MAASGINEHHEACRKQNFINRQTFNKKRLQDENPHVQDELNRKGACPSSFGPLSTYDLEKLAKKHGAAGTDSTSFYRQSHGSRIAALLAKCSERRSAVKQTQYLTYSAKINGRLSSKDYVQQW